MPEDNSIMPRPNPETGLTPEEQAAAELAEKLRMEALAAKLKAEAEELKKNKNNAMKLFENLDGDHDLKLDIVDLQKAGTLFNAFDFNADGEVNISDVEALHEFTKDFNKK